MFYRLNLRRKKTVMALVGFLLSIILAALLLFLLNSANKSEREEQDRLSQLNEELRGTFEEEDDEEESKILNEKLKKYDVYQKFREGLQVNALFLGNGAATSVSSGTRQWVFDVVDIWERNFELDVQGGNYARINTTAFYGYTMLNEYSRGLRYDIIVVCYGAEDDPADFAFYYDGLLRSIKNQNPKCEIYCIIEANPEGYNENADTVRLLCDYYGGVCIDMIKYFEENDVDYDTALDGINPTVTGSDIYLEAFRSAVEANLASGRRVPENTASYDAKADCFDKFTFVAANALSKATQSSYEYVTDDPVIAIMYYNTNDGGTIRIYANDVEVAVIDNKLKQNGVRQVATAVAGTNFEGRTVVRVEAGSQSNLTNVVSIVTCGED